MLLLEIIIIIILKISISKIDIKKIMKRRGKYLIWGDGTLSTSEDRTIYFAKNLQVGLFDNLTYDFGGDPDLDSF